MKNFAKRVSALVLALVVGAAALCPAALAAASLPDLPRDQCVVDDANVLSDSTTQTIIDLNAQLEQSCNGAQIGVLTVDYTGNYSTEDYATQAFNAWGIGDATKTCYADAVGRKISCSDSETFKEIVNILRSAGYEVCGV